MHMLLQAVNMVFPQIALQFDSTFLYVSQLKSLKRERLTKFLNIDKDSLSSIFYLFFHMQIIYVKLHVNLIL